MTLSTVKNSYQPMYKIIGHEFRDDLNRTFIQLLNYETEEVFEMTALQISLNKALLNQLSANDAHLVGYATASEQMAMEQERIKALRDKKQDDETK